MIYPPGPDTIQMQYKSKKFADCLVNNQHTSAFQTTNLGACTECHIVMEVLHDICDCVHMYTQSHSHYSSVPCCLVNVTLEVYTHLKTYINRVFLFCLLISKGLYSVRYPPGVDSW